jgi:hypothetical protein
MVTKVWLVRVDEWEWEQVFTVCATPELAEVERLMLQQEHKGVGFVIDEHDVLDDIVKRKGKD